MLIAINGSQGSGKSTLGAYLAQALTSVQGLQGVSLSIDDFYLTRARRKQLARDVHPLLRTRGVPGTHDIGLLAKTLDGLAHAVSGDAPVPVPSFDKSRDDRRPVEDWPRVSGPVDVIILEGWCLGATSEAPEALAAPVNALERNEDADVSWRGYCDQSLREHYEPFYRNVDLWVMLKAPGFESVLAWRQEQEDKLAVAVGGAGRGLMSREELQRFVAHYERYTRQCLQQLPATVDVLFELDEQRQIVSCRGLPEAP